MRRIASRLLTHLVRLYRDIVTWFASRLRRKTRRKGRPALGLTPILSPLEGRDHTGNVVGGIALAGLGFSCTDPLDAMALAVGDLALYGGNGSTGNTPPITMGDSATPVTQWLPDDLSGLDLVPALREPANTGAVQPDGETAQFLAKPFDDIWLDSLGNGDTQTTDGGFGYFATSADAASGGSTDGGGGAAGMSGRSEANLGFEPGGQSSFDFLAGGEGLTPQPLGGGGESEPEGGGGAGGGGEPLGSPPGGGGVPGASPPGGEGGGGDFGEPEPPVGASDESGIVPLVLVVATDPNASEAGLSTGQIRLTRVGPIDSPLTVAFELGGDAVRDDGEALDPDYTLDPTAGGTVAWGSATPEATGEVTFAAGARTVTLTVTPIDDDDPESTERIDFGLLPSPDKKYSVDRLYHAAVDLSSNDDSSGSSSGSGSGSGGSGTADPLVWVTAADPTSAEGGGTAAFEFFRDTTAGDLKVYYRLMTKNTATVEVDYNLDDDLLGSGLRWVEFTQDKNRLTVVLDPEDDSLLEGEETVWVELVPPPGTVGDFVWHDLNADGIQSQSEPGIKDVTVRLYDADDNYVTETTTDDKGYYEFTGLGLGTYSVQFDKPTGHEFSPQTQGTDTGRDSNPDESSGKAEFTLTADNPGDNSLDAGLYQPTKVTGRLWYDTNGNGLQDGTSQNPEPGVDGVDVKLYSADGSYKTDTTDSQGNYEFTDVGPGDYTVQFPLPAGYVFTTPDVFLNFFDTIDSDAPSGGKTTVFTVESGKAHDYDAGVLAGIGDFVWDDLNADGKQGGGEPGIQYVPVALQKKNDSGVWETKDSTQTDADGYYKFTAVPDGNYRLLFSPPTSPAGYVFTKPDVGPPADDSDAADAKTAQIDPINRPLGATKEFTAKGGGGTMDLDAGLYKPGRVSGLVWTDDNGDGVRGGTYETGIPGVEVKLISWQTGQAVGDPVTTGSDGKYTFADVAPGDYYVRFTPPSTPTREFTWQDAGSDDALDSDANVGGVTDWITVTSGADTENVDAGLYEPVTIGDVVWADDGDGIQQTELGLKADVTLHRWTELLGVGLWLPHAATTSDAATKEYEFEGVRPGKYYLQFRAPSGYTVTKQDQGGDETDSDPDSSGKTAEFTVTSGKVDGSTVTNKWDAGFVSAIGDRVWHDEDGNGLQDSGEEGVQGVTVTLERKVDGNWVAQGQPTQTDSNGSYWFKSVVDGDYRLKFDTSGVSGYVFTKPDQGAADKNSDAADTATATADRPLGYTPLFTITDGNGRTDWDAGLCKPASIGDWVWYDQDGNGKQDSGEVGAAGVTVTLYDWTGQVKGTKTTDPDGKYEFPDLAPGYYDLKFEPPPGKVLTKSFAVSDPAEDSNPDPWTGYFTVSVESGEVIDDLDAGVTDPVTVKGWVWNDEDGKGIQDSYELGRDGVKVELLNSSGGVLAERTTSGGGFYSFTDITPDDYTVRVSAVSGAPFTKQDQPPSDATDSDVSQSDGTLTLSLTPGQTATRDAGVVPPGTASIGNWVWRDANSNGKQDESSTPNDPAFGLAGVTVTISDQFGNPVPNQNPVTTQGNGLYQFNNLAAGYYKLHFDPPAGYTRSPAGADPDTTLDSDPDPSTGYTAAVLVTPGQQRTDIDAGMIGSGSGSGSGTIEGVVWYELIPADGLRHEQNAGAVNWKVNLSGPVSTFDYTGADGKYRFTNLPAGTYTVTFEQTVAGYTPATQDVDGNLSDAIDSDPSQTTWAVTVPLSAGQTRSNVDAGLVWSGSGPPAGFGRIGNWVWYDTTPNARQDGGEQGAPLVEVKLRWNGSVVATGQTNSSGYYEFVGLGYGHYQVEFVKPSGYEWVTPNNAPEDYDSDADPATGYSHTVALGVGQVVTDVDAGLIGSGSGVIEGMVWYETVVDGKRIGAGEEAGASGWTVYLHGPVPRTTTTGPDGKYQFANLPAGTYRVEFEPWSNYYLTFQNEGSDDTIDSDPDQSTWETEDIVLGDGETESHWDAGLVWAGSGSGVIRGGDEPLGGWETLGGGILLPLSDPSQYRIGSPDRALATIADDDSKIVYSDTEVSPGSPISLTAGDVFEDNVLVATFTDADPTRTADHYYAEIDWGNGMYSEAKVEKLLDPGTGDEWYEVSYVPDPPAEEPIYELPGVFPVTVMVSAFYYDDPDDPGSAVVHSRDLFTYLTATVVPQPVVVIPETLSGSVGQYTGDDLTVATFQGPEDSADRYAAEVYMGDGVGYFSASVEEDETSPGDYTVTVPDYAYALQGTYSIRVVLRDTYDPDYSRDPLGEVVGTADSTITVEGPVEPLFPDLGSYPLPLTETEERGGYVVASFTLPAGGASEFYAAAIDWGDGSEPEDATIFLSGTSLSVISEPGHYADPGVYGVSVLIEHIGGDAVVIGTTAVVEDELVLQTGTAAIERSAGASGVGDFWLATMTSEDETDTSERYRAWVSWGDGRWSAGTVYGSGGSLWVGGNHQYANPGLYAATALVWDRDHSGQVWEARTTVTVVDVPQAADYDPRVVGVVRVEPADDFDDVRAWVAWNGDPEFNGLAGLQFLKEGKAVLGEANYEGNAIWYEVSTPFPASVPAEEGGPVGPGYSLPLSYGPRAEVVKGDNVGGDEWAVAAGDAPLSGQAKLEVKDGVVTVMTFTDPHPSEVLAVGHKAWVDWGDGDGESGTVEWVAAAQVYRVTVEQLHAYAAAGDYRVSVWVASQETGADWAGRNATLLSAFPIRVQGFRAYQRRDELDDATWVAAGPGGEVSLNAGAVRLWHALDFDQSPGTSVGRDPHLVYNSDTVNPRPVIEAVVPTVGLGGKILKTTLTWPGADPKVVRFPVPATAPAELVIAVQPDASSPTGVYDWSLLIEVEDEPGEPTPGVPQMVADGHAQVVNNTLSPFGAGWALDIQWRLVPNADGKGGALLVYGSGESRYFQKRGAGFAAPPEEFGILRKTSTGFVYQSEFGETWSFDPAGRLTAIADRNLLPTTFGYDGSGRLSLVTPTDRVLTGTPLVGIQYGVPTGLPGETMTVINESHGRAVQVVQVGGQVRRVIDPTGVGPRELTSDGGGRVLTETWGTQFTSYAYHPDTGSATGFELGTGFGSVYRVDSAAAWSLGGGVPQPLSPVTAPFTGAVKDPRTNSTFHTVDPLGRTSATTFADGTGTTEVRDKHGQVTRFTDERGFTTEWDYDIRGHVLHVRLPDGGGATYVNDWTYGGVRIAVDSYGRETRYRYDGQGNLIRATDRLGNETVYTYHDGVYAGLVATATDARSNTTTYVYDDARRLKWEFDADSNKAEYLYDGANGFGNVTAVIDPLTRTTTTGYDELNRVRVVTDVSGGESEWTYDAQGRVLTETDAREVVTKLAYDSRGLLTGVTEAYGTAIARTTWFEYDKALNQIKEWQPRAYDDPLQVPLGVDDPFWNLVVTTHDQRNRPATVTEGAAYGPTFNPNNVAHPELWSSDDGKLARTTTYGYDAAGNLIGVKYRQEYDNQAGPAWIWDLYAYDKMGRVESAVAGSVWMMVAGVPVPLALGRQTTTKYDLDGNVSQVRGPDGELTVYGYDALDRRVSTVEAAGTPDSRVTQVGYDKVGNVEWTSEAIPTAAWLAGWWLGVTGTKTVYGYDKLNRNTTVTEAAGTPFQRTTLYEYDAVGRVKWEWSPRVYGYTAPALLPDGTPTHIGSYTTYNDTARTVTVTDAASVGATTQSPSLSPLNHAPPSTTTQYDEVGNVVLVTDPLGRKTKYVHDALGRQTVEMENWSSVLGLDVFARRTDWAYDAADNLRQETRGGFGSGEGGTGWQSVTDKFGYDVHNRQIQVQLATVVNGVLTPNSAFSTTSEYDALDNLTLQTDAVGVRTKREYNQFGDVTRLSEGASSSNTYTYLRNTDYTYDSAGRVKTVTTDRFTTGQTGDGGPARVTTQYGYDHLGRQVKVTEALGTDKQRTTTSLYDPNDRLVAVIEPLWIPSVSPALPGSPLPLLSWVPRTTVYAYDTLGRNTVVTEAYGAVGSSRTTRMGYDAADNLVWEATPRRYDTDAVGTGSPALSTLLAITPTNAAVTVHTYDGLDRRTSTTEAANAKDLGHAPPKTQWRYDAVGRVVLEIEPEREHPNGGGGKGYHRARQYGYDTLDQVVVVAEGTWTPVPNPNQLATTIRREVRGYDGAGNLVHVASGLLPEPEGNTPERMTDFVYDALGRLRTTTEWIDPNKLINHARVTEHAYDARGDVEYQTVRPLEYSIEQLRSTDKIHLLRRTKFSYDTLGRMTAQVEGWSEPGIETDLSNANLTATGPDGKKTPTTTYTYNAADQILTVTDPRGVRTDYGYDVLGRRTSQTEAANKSSEWLGKSAGDVGAGGHDSPITFWAYDVADRVVAETNPQNVVTTFVYDAYDHARLTTEAANTAVRRSTAAEYDAAGNLTRLTTGLSSSSTPNYQHVTTTRFDYDALGRQKMVQYADDLPDFAFGSTDIFGKADSRPWTKFTYDQSGNVIKVMSNASLPTGQLDQKRDTSTVIAYDPLDRPTRTEEGHLRIIRGDGVYLGGFESIPRITNLEYNRSDDVTQVTKYSPVPIMGGPPGVAGTPPSGTNYVYDLLGRRTITVLGTKAAVNEVVALMSQGNLDLLHLATAPARINLVAYNVFDEVLDEYSALNITKHTYNRLGQHTKTTTDITTTPDNTLDEGRHFIEYSYDIASQVTAVTDQVQPSWYFGANLFNVIDPSKVVTDSSVKNTGTTGYEYDALGRVVAATDQHGQTTRYRFDELGRNTNILDRNGKSRAFDYDDLGRVKEEQWSTGTTRQGGFKFIYDAADNRTAEWHYSGSNSDTPDPNSKYEREYDALNRLKVEHTPFNLDLTYRYDAMGRAVEIKDSSGGNVGGTLSSEYDGAGRVIVRALALANGNGEYFALDYRDHMIVQQVLDHVGTIKAYSRATPPGQNDVPVLRVLINSTPQGEIRSRLMYPGQPGQNPNVPLENFVYDLHPITGNVEQERRMSDDKRSATNKFTYDAKHGYQLTLVEKWENEKWVEVPGTKTDYDSAGMVPFGSPDKMFTENLALAQASKNDGRRDKFADMTTMTRRVESWTNKYDAEGNVTEQRALRNVLQVNFDFVTDLTYDHRNQLVEVTEKGFNNPLTGTGGYTNASVNYRYDAEGRLIERKEGTNVTRYVYVGDQIYADLNGSNTVVSRYVVGDDGVVLGRVDANADYYYATDRIGSVAAIYRTDPGGTTLTRVKATAYAGLKPNDALTEVDPTFSDRHEHAGRWTDGTTRLQYHGGRWLDPKTGQYLSQVGGGRAAGDTSLYRYADNSWPNLELLQTVENARQMALRAFQSMLKPEVPWYELVWKGVKNAAREMYYMARDVIHTARTAYDVYIAGNPNPYLPDLKSGGFKAYEDAVRRGDMAGAGKVQARAMLGVVTLGASEPAIAGWNWATGQGSREEFYESLGGFGFGVATMGVGLGLGRLTSAGRAAGGSRAGMTFGQATRSVAGTLAGIGFDLALPFVRPVGAVAGRGLGWSVRKTWGTGNKGEQSNWLSRQVHNADLTHKTGIKAWAARQVAEWTGTKVCFVAGTPIQWQHGSKAVERFRSYEECGDDCDRIVSRSEHDPDGVLVLRRVLRRFERTGLVVNLLLPNDVGIGTTSEHPFYEREKGWTPCHELRAGDEIRLMDGGWVRVEGVEYTGRVETVYNLEVEDDHTYFVGCDEWGFSVWAHNA